MHPDHSDIVFFPSTSHKFFTQLSAILVIIVGHDSRRQTWRLATQTYTARCDKGRVQIPVNKLERISTIAQRSQVDLAACHGSKSMRRGLDE